MHAPTHTLRCVYRNGIFSSLKSGEQRWGTQDLNPGTEFLYSLPLHWRGGMIPGDGLYTCQFLSPFPSVDSKELKFSLNSTSHSRAATFTDTATPFNWLETSSWGQQVCAFAHL